MSEAFALLKEFKRGSYNAAVLCSYNVYFPFFENVLLPAMRTQECQHVVVFMDARQLGRCLQDQELSPRLAGRHYTLIPVHVPGAFHPKLALLVGKHATRVMVGSHNLTLSGFGQNHEVTNVTVVECQRSPSRIHRRSAKRIQSSVPVRVAPLGVPRWVRQIGQADPLV